MADEKKETEPQKNLEDFEVTELEDEDLEGVAGGADNNCGCGGGDNNCGCGPETKIQ